MFIEYSHFLYPPLDWDPNSILNLTSRDAINVSWTTSPSNAHHFTNLNLLLLWAAPPQSPPLIIVNETVPLDGSRIYSLNYGHTFPAFAYFALSYLVPSEEVTLFGERISDSKEGVFVNGPPSSAFRVTDGKKDSSMPGRLWSQDGSEESWTEDILSKHWSSDTSSSMQTAAGPVGSVVPLTVLGFRALAFVGLALGILLVAVFRRRRSQAQACNEQIFAMQNTRKDASAPRSKDM